MLRNRKLRNTFFNICRSFSESRLRLPTFSGSRLSSFMNKQAGKKYPGRYGNVSEKVVTFEQYKSNRQLVIKITDVELNLI